MLWTGTLYWRLDSLVAKGIKRRQFLNSRKKIELVQAVAVPISPSPADTAEYRKELSESYGFKQIGESLPENVTLKDVIDTLPKKVIYYYSKNQIIHSSFLSCFNEYEASLLTT